MKESVSSQPLSHSRQQLWTLPFLIIIFSSLLFVCAVVVKATDQTVASSTAWPSPVVASPLPSPTPTPAGQLLTADTRVPIVMYHYIRDYNRKRDRVGTNLSVSPETFTRQLQTLKDAGYTAVTFQDLDKPLPAKPIILTFDDGYDDAYTTVLPALQAAGMKGMFYIVTDFMDKSNYMSRERVKILDAAGMEIGAHTVHHKDLRKLGREDQRKELQESKTVLEALLGKSVTAFCFPAGFYTNETIALAKEVGFKTATTVEEGIVSGKDIQEKPYELRRIRVTNTTDILKEIGARD